MNTHEQKEIESKILSYFLDNEPKNPDFAPIAPNVVSKYDDYSKKVIFDAAKNGFSFLNDIRQLYDEQKPAITPHVASKQFQGKTDLSRYRKDFPILSRKINGKNLIWFDNGATTQKPKAVIDRLTYFYENENSNIHRGAHTLAAIATDAYEEARKITASFINAPSPDNIVFVRGTTEGINLVANAFGCKYLKSEDEIIISHLEHHANIVPWQLICEKTGAKLRVIPVDESGQIILSEFEKLINPRTKFVSITHVSNALGTIAPVKEVVQTAHAHGIRVLVDAAQSISHLPIDVTDIDADFLVFSGHKIYAPTGIGVLYGKEDALKILPPYQGGGNMIADVTFERTIYQEAPAKFEAGTGNIADSVGLGAALKYVSDIGMENIARYESELLFYATSKLSTIDGVKIVGTALNKASVLSFTLDGFTTDEIGKTLNANGIAVRTGHHCAQPILRRFGLESVVRATFAFYNTFDEIDEFISVISELKR
ncbi:MAG: cysteine desulfurase [Campylobacteraceae bacterium]|jgi:cysteine desulfurase/selenocysteine lyase|nr:cysteine desulfurase [Campylobacteraceae bacterium]